MSLRKGKRFLRLAALLLALTAMAVPAWATNNYYVKTDGSDEVDGKSWDAAFKTIEKALKQASDNDNIYVAKGTYMPKDTYNPGPGNPAPLSIVRSVKIYGGFAGTETTIDLSKRDLSENATTITCPKNGRVPLIGITTTLSLTIVIDGFTLTGGKDEAGANGNGIFIDNDNGTVTVQNCVIKNNESKNGGGMYVQSGTVNVTNCVFDNNKAASGGGIYVKAGTATMTQCTFKQNQAFNIAGTTDVNFPGGGVYVENGKLSVTNCTFVKNSAITGDASSGNAGGGAVYIKGATSPVINYCTFVGNTGEPGANVYNADAATLLNVTNSILYYTGSDNFNNAVLAHCATRAETKNGTNPVFISGWTPGDPATDTTKGVPHSVYRIEDNLSALKGLIEAASGSPTPNVDQLGNTRDTKPDIGAVEFDKTKVTVTVTPSTTTLHGTKDVELTKNNSVTFSTTPDLGYKWDFDTNGNGITDSKITAKFNDAKTTLTLGGTPQTTTTGDGYVIKLKGTSDYGPDQTATVNLTVGEITVDQSTKSITGYAGTKLNESVTFTPKGGQTGNYTWSKKVDGSIAGVTVGNIDTTGKMTFSGTPTATGQITVMVTAADSGESGTASVTLTVSDPEINVSSGTEGTSISTNINTQISNKTLTFTASPAALNYDWTLDKTEQGGLTATLSGSGNTAMLTLNGTPTKAESYTFTVKAAFGNKEKEVTVTVNVNDPSVTVTANPSTLYAQAGKELVPANCKSNLMASSASGGSENWTWTVDKAELDGVKATLSATTGSNVTLTLSGTPREIKDYTFTVRAAAGSKANTATVTLKVTAPGGITLTPSATEAIALVGNTVFYPSEISFDAAPSQNYAWTVDGGSSAEKDGITATLTGSGNTAKLAFSGTPTAEGSYKFNVAAAFGEVAASQDITVTVYKPDVGFESVNDPNLISKMEQDFMNLLNGVPAGTKIYFNMEGVHFANPDAFLISVQRWAQERGYDVIANISPLMVENAPGVYFMKLNMSDDKRAMMTNSFNVDYHVERSADIEVSGTENNVVKVAADPAKDGSNGILVDEEGNPLGTYYNGSDLYLLVYLARSNEWYVQYLTMEQNSGPTSNKGPGCDHSCNSGFVGTSAAALLVLLFAPTGSKRKEKK